MPLDGGMRDAENDFPRPGIVGSPGMHSGNGQLTTSYLVPESIP